MSGVPAGYEAFQSKKRKGVTLLCFLLASTMAMGITVYVDSYSVHEWDKNLDVGEIAIIAQGQGIQAYIGAIREIDGVTKSASLRTGYGNLRFWVNDTWGLYEEYIWGDTIAPDQEFMETFPGYITLVEGSFPTTNMSEIAVINELADYYGIGIGDVLNYSNDLYMDELVEVIGIYSQGQDENSNPYYWNYESIVIVVPDAIYSGDNKIFIDIDRTRVTAFNAAGSLAYSNGIDQAIRMLDPAYDPQNPWSSRFWASNRISTGITTYMYWVQSVRITQLFRATSIILLILMVTFLAIRHNVNERRFESSILYSRGAASRDLDKIVNREIFILSIFSCILGIFLGIGISRVAVAATGFFQFDFALMISEPFLITLDSLIISVIAGIALPILALGSYRVVYSTKKSVDQDQGRLSKVVKGLNFVKWDVLVVGLAGVLLMALVSGGSDVQNNPILGLILPIVPLPLFLGVASLSIKGLRTGAGRISRTMTRVVGQIPASIGIRRIGKGASSGGAAAMVLVLAISLSWNSAIVDASLPITKTYQGQLSVGADITFALDNNKIEQWDNFTLNVTSNANVVSATYVSETGFYLSSGYGGYKTFLAVNPREYTSIGYHYLGNRLNNSEMASMLVSLESVLDGAIISRDTAQEYNLEVGDILRASEISEEAIPFIFRVIAIVEAIPEMPSDDYWYYYDYIIMPPMVPYFPYTDVVGQDRVMINREYLRSLLGALNQTNNFLCVSTLDNANGTETGESLLEAGGYEVLYQNLWDSVSSQTDEFLKQTSYHIDRSVDTMLTVLTVGTIMGAFAVYAVEGVRARRREIALLRSAGADSGLIVKAQGAEMLILMLFSLIVLLAYAPLFLSTSISTIRVSAFETYPVSVFLIIPWLTIFTVLAFFIVSIMIFIGFVAFFGSRINLAQTLNASWAEAAPYGEDM
ncbi:MAG: ABC transporter permease [Candidatus Thorarchaeota archaeon]|nr:MAG: ABC transporter permease [Candidatus Thorarchaeota archaeon]